MTYPEFNLKFFLSGALGKAGEERDRLVSKFECCLRSCHGSYLGDAKFWAKQTHNPNVGFTKMLLDSGAFTAWSKGARVELDHLIATYHTVMDLADRDKVKIWLINLDVIPGSPGVTAGAAEVAEAIAQSDRNFEILVKEFGNCVLPVYHQGEDEQRLQQVASMSEYICVSPRNDLPEWSRVQWAEEVHRKLPSGIRTHGLATTGDQMMSRVPWWSVDSSSWLYVGAMGSIRFWNGSKWTAISISKESSDKYAEGKHYDNAATYIKEIVDAKAAKHNVTIQRLRDDMTTRYLFNALEIVEWLTQFEFKKPKYQPSLFEL